MLPPTFKTSLTKAGRESLAVFWDWAFFVAIEA